MTENIQTPVGYLVDLIPIWQTEGITKEQAETVSKEIIIAHIYLKEQNDNSYSKLISKLQEIHIVSTVVNDEYKYDLYSVGNKFIIKFKYNVTYSEAIYCFINAVTKVNK